MPSMPSEPIELIRLWWERFNATGEPPIELCHEDFEMRNPADFLLAARYHGHEGIRRWAEDVWGVFETLRFEVEELVVSPDGATVASVQRAVGATRHTGIPVDFRWSTAYTFADGKIASASGYLTRGEAMRAAGL